MIANPFLGPAAALVGWTMIVTLWMLARRGPAMRQIGAKLQDAERMRDLADRLPRKAQRVAENYNHLMEQPTAFYPTMLIFAAIGTAPGWELALGWFYVASRVLHSLVQGTVNVVLARALLFTAGTFALIALGARLCWLVFVVPG